MNKISFDQKIKDEIHGYLYFINNKEVSKIPNSYGCFKKNKSYTIYHIDHEGRFIFLGAFNCESDAYEYLDEISSYLHFLEIEKILNAYSRLSRKEKKLYQVMIDFYLSRDSLFCTCFKDKIENYKVKKRKR